MKTLILLAFMLMANVFAGELQETACDDKSLSYCINHFDRQCDAKNYGACFIVGMLHNEQEQYGKAKKYFEMVCDKANSNNIYQVELMDGGMGNKLPVIKNMQVSCDNLGKLYYNGLGVRQSYKKALHYSKKACDLGSGDGCGNVGGLYYLGEGVTQDLKSAIKFFTKACELKYGSGCAMLGAFYHDGDVVKQNLSKAKELFGKACDLGFQTGCDKYKELKEKGY